eukprot:3954969-Ditylum_brightwellii.AAC.1
MHTMRDLTDCVSDDIELTKENSSIAVIGGDRKFTFIEGNDLQPYMDWLELDDETGGGDDDDTLIAETHMQPEINQ